MTVTDSYTLTDDLAKTNSDMFPTAKKLIYFNIAKNLLFSLLAQGYQDRHEEEDTKTTIAGQSEYAEKARIHHVNWLKVNYGNGLVPARYVPEADLVNQYGTELEATLTGWSYADPIYNYKGSHLFVYPAPTVEQAGADRLKVSLECYPADMTTGADVIPVPIAFEHIPAVYAAWRYHDNNGEDAQAAKRASELPPGMIQVDLDSIDPEHARKNYFPATRSTRATATRASSFCRNSGPLWPQS